MTVSQRIYAGFFLITLLAVTIFGVGLLGFNAINGRVQYLANDIEPSRTAVNSAHGAVANASLSLLRFSRESQQAQLLTLEQTFATNIAAMQNGLSEFKRRNVQDNQTASLEQAILDNADKFANSAKAVFDEHRQVLKLNGDIKASDRRLGDQIDIMMGSISSNRNLDELLKSEAKQLTEYVVAITNAAKGKSSILEINADINKLEKLFERIAPLLSGEPRLQQSLEKLKTAAIAEGSLLTNIASKIEQTTLLEKSLQASDAFSKQLHEDTEKLESAIGTLASESMQYTLDETEDKRILLITFAVSVIAVAIVISLLVIRSILPPLHQLIRVANDVASGNLTVDINTHRQDEIGHLSRAMHKLVMELRHILSQINAGADQLAAAAEQFSIMSEQSASYAGQQMEETQNFAAAIVEMSASVEHIATSSSDTLNAVGQTRNQVLEGQRKMEAHVSSINLLAKSIEQAGANIDQLSEVSTRIGSILDAIRSIADQTNLLALNAAIEAARAGEQGRGFAVVADEVRTLASRTGASTTEIQGMIERLHANMREAVHEMGNSRQCAHTGMTEVQQANESFSKISTSVDTIREMNIQIASATEEQSTVAASLAKNVAHVSELAESNARTSKENLDVSRSLAQLAEAQRVLAHRFKLG